MRDVIHLSCVIPPPWIDDTEPLSVADLVRMFVRNVSLKTGIDEHRIRFGKGRKNDLIAARFEVMFLLDRRNVSVSAIGRVFKKHHATVLNAIQKHEERNGISPR